MWETLREWTIDNPFFRLEWKRWLRRGGPWEILAGSGNLCVVLLGLHVLYATASRFGQAFLDLPLSLTIFTLLALMQAFGWMGAGVPGFSLAAEAQEHRFPFIRLLPGDPRELVLKIGVARTLLRMVVLFSPLPIYLTLTWYGHPPLGDIAALFLLLTLALFGPPSPSEVTSALQKAEGWIVPGAEGAAPPASTAEAPAARKDPEPALRRRILMLVGVVVGLGVLLWAAALDRMGAARIADGVAGVLRQFLDKNFVAIFVLWMGEPRSFYRGELAPLWVLLAFWLVRGAIRVQEAGELWARGLELPPFTAKNAPLEPEAVRTEVEGVPTANRAVRLYREIALPLGSLLVLGFFWRWWMQSGRLGSWVGVPTVGGSLGTLYVVVTGFLFCLFFEVLRCGLDGKDEPPHKSLAGAVRIMAQALGVMLAFVFVAGLAGGAFPVRELLSFVPGLVAGAVALLTFGWGWRQFRSRWLVGPAGPITVLVRGLGHALLWVATYVAPAAVLGGWSVGPLSHRLVSISPIYFLLLQFAPLRSGVPLSMVEAATAPIAVGLGLAALSLLRRRPEEDPEMGTRDPLFSVLARVARDWDNPLFTMALRRRSVVSEHLTARLLRMPLVVMILSAGGAVFFLTQFVRRSGLSLAEILEQPARIIPGLNQGAATSLLAAAGLLMLSAVLGAGWNSAVAGESLGTGRRQQKQDLRLSPLSDAEILRGTLWGSLVEPLAGQITGPVVSLLWVLAAILYGAGAYWLIVWLGAAGTAVGLGWLTALDGFSTWGSKPRKLPARAHLAALGPAVLAMTVFLSPALFQLPGATRWLPLLLPLVALVSAVATFAQVPAAYRRAEGWVRESREEDEAPVLN